MSGSPVAVPDTFVDVPGGRLRARVLPGRAGTPVVFLHEALGGIAQWRSFPEELCRAAGRPGIIYERLGSGGSDPLPGPRGPGYLEEEVPRLEAVLDAVGARRPVLLGHSDGGTIALLFAAARPSRCAAVVSIAAHVFVEEVTVAGIRETVGRWATTDLRSRLAKHHGDKVDALFSAWADTWTLPGFRSWKAEGALRGVRCPALVLQGETDAFGTAAQVEAIARGVAGPVESRILAGVGHSPHLEAPAVVRDAVLAFLASHGA